LAGLVVQLPGEAAPLHLLSSDDAAKCVTRDLPREIDRDRGAVRELLGEPEVRAGESGIGADLVVRDEHADRSITSEERYVETGRRAQPSGNVLVHLRILEKRVDALASSALEHSSCLRVTLEVADRGEIARAFAVRRGDSQALAGRQGDRDEACADQLAEACGDEVEQRLELELSDERTADLVQRFELVRPRCGGFIEPRVFDRDGSLCCQQRRQLLILVREITATLLLRQIQVSVGHASEQDRDAEKRIHRRVAGRKADGARVLRQVVQPKVPGVGDEHAENSAAVRRIADPLLNFVRHPIGHEALQPGSCGVDHAKSGVLGICYARGRLDDSLEYAVEGQFGRDGDACLHERSQTF
jgi:hypothetical protein